MSFRRVCRCGGGSVEDVGRSEGKYNDWRGARQQRAPGRRTASSRVAVCKGASLLLHPIGVSTTTDASTLAENSLYTGLIAIACLVYPDRFLSKPTFLGFFCERRGDWQR